MLDCMQPDPRRVWVAACGDTSRRYRVEETFRKRKICAIGPAINVDAESNNEELSVLEHNMIQRFKDTARDGDIVILRAGLREIRSVGVMGDYEFDQDLGIAAWNLAHVRPTSWLQDDTETGDEMQKLSNALSKGFPRLRFSELAWHQNKIKDRAIKLVDDRGLKSPGGGYEPLSLMSAEEFVAGLPRELLEVVNASEPFGVRDYTRLEADPVAMIIVPFLMALGVPRKYIRVEVPLGKLPIVGEGKVQKRVDVVVFGDETLDKPLLIIEAKRRWEGLGPAREQVLDYAAHIDSDRKKNLWWMTTDGSEIEFGDFQDEARHNLSMHSRTKEGSAALKQLSDHIAPT